VVTQFREIEMIDLEKRLSNCLASYCGLPNIDVARASLIRECCQLLSEQGLSADVSIDFDVDEHDTIIDVRLYVRSS